MRRFQVSLIISLLIFVGCASTSKNVDTPQTLNLTTRYLDNSSAHQLRLESFSEKYKNPSERHKIQFLLDSVSKSELTFIRNGVSYKNDMAVKWLKRKWHHKRLRTNPIRSAKDFIERCATKSNTTGKPYLVKWEDGRLYESAAILHYELEALDYFLLQKQITKVSEESLEALEPSSEGQIQNTPEIAIPPTPVPGI